MFEILPIKYSDECIALMDRYRKESSKYKLVHKRMIKRFSIFMISFKIQIKFFLL